MGLCAESPDNQRLADCGNDNALLDSLLVKTSPKIPFEKLSRMLLGAHHEYALPGLL